MGNMSLRSHSPRKPRGDRNWERVGMDATSKPWPGNPCEPNSLKEERHHSPGNAESQKRVLRYLIIQRTD